MKRGLLLLTLLAGMAVASTGYILAASIDKGDDESSFAMSSYTADGLEFEIAYPDHLVVAYEREGFVIFTDPAFLGHEGEYPSVRVVVHDNAEGLELTDWYSAKEGAYVGDRSLNEARNVGVVLDERSNDAVTTMTFKSLGELRSTVIKRGDRVVEFLAHSLGSLERDPALVKDYEAMIGAYLGQKE